MKARLVDGTEIDLGTKYVLIYGEPTDDTETIHLTQVRAAALNCVLEAHHCFVTEKSTNNVIYGTTNLVSEIEPA